MATEQTSWWSKDTVAVVTGANQGVGLEVARQLAEQGLTVVLTARDPARGQAALDGLVAQGLKSIKFHTLDICSQESTKNLAVWLKEEFGGIDILINNAATLVPDFTYENAERVMNTNYRSVKYVTKTLLPLLRASPAGARIVNVSSRGGMYESLKSDSLKQKFRDEDSYSEEMADSLATKYLEDAKAGDVEEWNGSERGSNPTYCESKMFLNVYAAALAKSLAASQPEDHQIFVVGFCPGVTQTTMLQTAIGGGFEPPQTPDWPLKTAAEGADTGVWLALLPKKELAEKNGKLFGERAEYLFGWSTPS